MRLPFVCETPNRLTLSALKLINKSRACFIFSSTDFDTDSYLKYYLTIWYFWRGDEIKWAKCFYTYLILDYEFRFSQPINKDF